VLQDHPFRGFGHREEEKEESFGFASGEVPKAFTGAVLLGAFRHTGYRDIRSPEDERSRLLGRKLQKD
jgi:hypothetical protein